MNLTRTIAAGAALWLLAGCAAQTQTFLHRSHRQNYAIQPDELKGVQFYISTEVLARNEAAGDTVASVVVLPVKTPGVVTAVGPNWLRVSFAQGGDGALFVTVPDTGTDSAYWLATLTDDGSEPRRLLDLDPKVIRAGGSEYRLVHGDGARLMIENKDLQQLIDARTHLQGRSPK